MKSPFVLVLAPMLLLAHAALGTRSAFADEPAPGSGPAAAPAQPSVTRLPLVAPAQPTATVGPATAPAAGTTAGPVSETAAPPADPEKDAADAALNAGPTTARMRDGVVIGASFGFGLGRGSGYPNDAKYIDQEAYRGASGIMPGYGWNILVMGALSDQLLVGFWGGTSAYEGGNWKSRASGGGFRVEAFPFGGLTKAVQNTAVYGEVGVGSTKTTFTKDGNYAPLEGTQSFVALGAFHEFWLAKAFTIAPDVRYEAVISRAGSHAAMVFGLRAAVYTGN